MADIILTPERAKKFSYSIPYFYDSLIFAIPPAKAYSSLEKLFFPFKMAVWIYICATFVIIMIVILFLKVMPLKKRNFVIGKQNDSPLLNVLNICFGGAITQYQLPHRNFARTILMILLLTTLVLRNAYLGNLFNFLRTRKQMEPLYYKRSIIDSDVSIFLSARYLKPFQEDFPKLQHR